MCHEYYFGGDRLKEITLTQEEFKRLRHCVLFTHDYNFGIVEDCLLGTAEYSKTVIYNAFDMVNHLPGILKKFDAIK